MALMAIASIEHAGPLPWAEHWCTPGPFHGCGIMRWQRAKDDQLGRGQELTLKLSCWDSVSAFHTRLAVPMAAPFSGPRPLTWGGGASLPSSSSLP